MPSWITHFVTANQIELEESIRFIKLKLKENDVF